MFLGLDCSTQSLSALILEAREGTILHEASVNFERDLPHFQTSSGFVHGDAEGEVFSDPTMWLEALDMLFAQLASNGIDLSKIEAISGSGQQHATVYLNDQFASTLATLDPAKGLAEQIRPSLTRPLSPIWMDGSSGEECEEIAAAVGGDDEVCRKSGSTTTKRFSGPQIRRFSKLSPEAWEQTSIVHLNSSFLASVIAGESVSIDHGDGAGMNLMNLASGDWDAELVAATATDLADKLPPLVPSNTITGTVSAYFSEKYQLNPAAKVAVWSGDNPCSLVGMGAASSGKMVISLGTSYTLFAAMEQPLTDPNGYGHVFGNPCGNFMSLICFHNGALCLERLKGALSLDWDEFNQQASISPTSGNQPTLPFYEPEITPLAAAASQENTTIRSLLDGQFLSMREYSAWMGETPTTVYVTGGASQSQGICQTIANVFNANVQRMGTSASASLGAAMRAAHATGEFTLDQLEDKFTQPAADSLITPEPDVVSIYNDMLNRFQTILANHTS